jgi:DNA-3-methyladenine glycosylase I
MKRCVWASGNDTLLREYHDNEYGRRKGGDRELFEKLCLECFQAGLSWRTVLYKRESFRKCFFDFDPEKVAAMTGSDVIRLMDEKNIIRNRRKIEAVINNARAHILYFGKEESFKDYVYSAESGEDLSKDLKKKGYHFVGPTICESFLMSVGAIEGHETVCFLHGTKI